MPLPHDAVDLQLAPVALAIDKELSALGRLAPDQLEGQIMLAVNRRSSELESRRAREETLIWLVTRFVPLHGWEVALEERGLRMAHRGHTLVLGLPATVRGYLAAAEA